MKFATITQGEKWSKSKLKEGKPSHSMNVAVPKMLNFTKATLGSKLSKVESKDSHHRKSFEN